MTHVTLTARTQDLQSSDFHFIGDKIYGNTSFGSHVFNNLRSGTVYVVCCTANGGNRSLSYECVNATTLLKGK